MGRGSRATITDNAVGNRALPVRNTANVPNEEDPVELLGCLDDIEYCTYNLPNTLIVVVSNDESTRLQQLWKVGEGLPQVLWIHKQIYDRKWTMYLRFSQDGRYAAFHDGESSFSMTQLYRPRLKLPR